MTSSIHIIAITVAATIIIITINMVIGTNMIIAPAGKIIQQIDTRNQ